jgi:hypothetical protein
MELDRRKQQAVTPAMGSSADEKKSEFSSVDVLHRTDGQNLL